MPKVNFNGSTETIEITEAPTAGVVELDVKVDLYSDWKEWVTADGHAQFNQVFRAIGGDEKPGGKFVPPNFFLKAPWQIEPYDADHILRVSSNLFRESGSTLDLFIGKPGRTINIEAELSADGVIMGGVPTTGQIATEVMKLDWTTITGEAERSLLNALRGQFHVVIADPAPGATTTTMTVYKEDGQTVAWTATVTLDDQNVITQVVPD